MTKNRRTSKARDFGDKESVAAVGTETALDQTDEESARPEAVSPAEAETFSEKSPSPAEERPYTVGSWRGFPQHQCKLCPWDTLEGEAKMLEHLASAHAPPPEPKSPILIAKS